ncbi:TPR repeat-containing protein YrrB [Posidoniimonas polymericola]|uniref:TPR repeat-containing protein YrrB n=1 Tax=Posidoniimonas polymericola TaxID=2528002 RepID=A0A5C5ZEG2_9BACT|nr:tetratricopeptide repeat protein [Posidoniimonas polymericola]TWT85447.1 TPR repeat-containing protein YrrB [Posidoniimonas polymericola]
MQATSIYRIALGLACVASLVPAGVAQEVSFVDDYSAASSRYPLPQPQSSPTARRVGRSVSQTRIPAGTPMPSSMSREQAARLFTQQASDNAPQKSGGALSKLTSGFKGLFSRDDSRQSAANNPPQQPPRGIQQAGFAGGRTGSPQTPQASAPMAGRPANGGLNLRQGDDRQGLFDYLGSQTGSGSASKPAASSNQNMVASQSSSRGSTSSSRGSTQSSRGSTLKTRSRNSSSSGPSSLPMLSSPPQQSMPQAVVQSPMPGNSSRPLAPAKPSDDVVMISDEPAAPRVAAAPMPIQPAAPMSIASQPVAAEPMVIIASDDPADDEMVVATDDEPLFVSDLEETHTAAAMPAPVAEPAKPIIAAQSAPLPVVTGPTPQPLVMDNPMINEPAHAMPVVTAAPRQVAQTPQPVKQAAPQPVMQPAKKPAARVAVLPNPVAVAAEEQRKEPSDRAAALLAEAHYMARDAQSEEDFTRVVQQCRHVLAIDESTVAVSYSNELASWALNKRGELKADLGMVKEAMADFDEAVTKDAGQWRAIHNRGVLMAQAGKFAEAFDAFNKTIELNGEFAKAHSNRASLYVQAGEFETALADYRRAIMLDPDLVVAHKGRGRVCHVVGRLEEALQHFEAAAALAPDDAGIATCRADLLVDMGRYSQAASGYVRAIEIDPADPIAHRNLAWLQATCPDRSYVDGERALANAERAIELAGGEDDICLDTLAAAQATAGDFAAAVETIKQAIALAPSADQGEYAERLELYQQEKPFRSHPAGVRQASYAGESGAGLK